MSNLTRRTLIAAAGTATAAGLVTQASAEGQDPAFFGGPKDGRVEMPPLHAPSEGGDKLPNREPPGKRLGVAVVGIGHLTLVPAFGSAKNVRLAALVSGHRDTALAIAAQNGVPPAKVYDYAGFDAIRNDPDVDIVYIVLPNAQHLEFTQRAAAAGKHVLCEKPMANSVAEAEAMIKACRDAGRKLMIEAVNGQNDVPGQWRQIKALAGGGSLPDVGIYCLNAFRYLTGEEPVEVTGRVTRPKDDPRFREIEDIAMFTLAFSSGVVATGSSGYSFHEDRRLRCAATDGWFGMDPAFSYAGLLTHIGRKLGPATSVETRSFAPKNQFAVEMDHFAAAIRAGRESHTPGEEGLADMRVMAAIYESAMGGSAVKLPRVEGLDTTRGPLPAEG